jgi:hypothetical protein
MKEYADKRRNARKTEVKIGDSVLAKRHSVNVLNKSTARRSIICPKVVFFKDEAFVRHGN